jgi:hypothetical protein
MGVLCFVGEFVFYVAELERTMILGGVGVFAFLVLGCIFLTLAAGYFGFRLYEIKEGMEELEHRYNSSNLASS